MSDYGGSFPSFFHSFMLKRLWRETVMVFDGADLAREHAARDG